MLSSFRTFYHLSSENQALQQDICLIFGYSAASLALSILFRRRNPLQINTLRGFLVGHR